jgi:plasmid stabilization system protein ParE
MPKVRLSDQAKSYLRTEAAYLRHRSQPAADAFLSRMREARRTLGQFPEAGFEKKEITASGIRRYIVGAYLLDYDIRDGDVFIAAIRPAQKPEYTTTADEDFDYEESNTPRPPVS